MFGLYDRNLMMEGMRTELTGNGFAELRTPEDVDAAFAELDGTTLLLFNSVCGCAAGSARPGVVQSLADDPRPARLLTVFAGQDREATARAREHLATLPVSSPSAVLLKDGEVRFQLHRHDIEGHTPQQVAEQLRRVYQEHCG